jgi:hypothetical protein
LYESQSAGQTAGAAGTDAGPGQSAAEGGGDDDAIDAEFEVKN